MITKKENLYSSVTTGKSSASLALIDKLYSNKQLIGIFAVLILLSVFFTISSEAFLTTGNILNLIQQLAPNLIVVVVMTLVITTGGIDLSVGSILALSSALTAVFLGTGMGSFLTLVLVLLAGAVIGWINGFVSAYFIIPPFIVTLASMIFLKGIALFVTGGYSIAIDASNWLVAIGRGRLAGIPISALLAVFVAIVGVIALRQTRYGNYVTGIGSNEESVRRAGVDIKKVKLVTYIFSGIAASLAGLIIAARLGSGSSNVGFAFELNVIAAVVLGGTSLIGGFGTILGSIIGVTLIGVINNGLTLMHVSPYLIQIIQGLVLLIAVIVNMRVLGKSTQR